MRGHRLTPAPTVTFGEHTYCHQQIWALIRALQTARLRVTLWAHEEERGYLMYEAVLASKTAFASSGQHGSPFLALRAAVNAMHANAEVSSK